jgi:hypothetical protein
VIEELLDALHSPKPRIRYGAAKALRQCSVETPQQLYPHFDRFVELADGENTILRWTSQRILGNLAAADRDGRCDAVLDRFLAPILRHQLIDASNTIASAGQMARAQPHLADRIAAQFLKVSRATYATPECRNVAIGHALRELNGFLQHVSNRRQVLAFARRQLDNPRAPTRRCAERLLARWSA